jgi:hypothetical protein
VIYRRLADLVVVVHALLVVLAMFGTILSGRYPWVALIHIPLAAWVTALLIMDLKCPLTPLENQLRNAAGEQGYEGSFVDHYLVPIVAPSQDKRGTRRGEIAAGVFFGGVSFWMHAMNFAKYRDAIASLIG